MKNKLRIVLEILLAWISSAVPDQTQNEEAGLFPMVFNLASRSIITSNATCGELGRETYCKLLEHVKGEMRHHVQCGVCDAGSAYEDERHPITHAIDGTHGSWQSPSLINGLQYHWVTITLDLRQIYQVAYIVLTAGNAPRPGNWVLERSLDGAEYKPWQYYAISDSECWNNYDIPPTVGIPRYKTDDEVICTSFYSRLNPFENGEIHTSLVNGRPGVEGPTQTLLDFTKARYVRLRLQRIRTLHADLMTFVYNDPRDLDPTVSNRYFYSIKDISIGGQCICSGHAQQCPIDPETQEMQCECEGNTCGVSCDQCCPLYNQQPWQPGTYSQNFQCQRCQCFNHSDACVYNQTVADLRLSVNIDGDFIGGGVCLDCRDHTRGVNCELCEAGYYRSSEVSPYSRHVCQPCRCQGPGTTGDCVSDNCMEMFGVYAGDCICREGYFGPRCEQCAMGYTGWPRCQPCHCDIAGSANVNLCDDECICKPHVCGDRCEECLSGFYNLDLYNPNGCDPCFCFGLSHECQSTDWGSSKLTTLEGWTVTDFAGSRVMTPRRHPSGILTINPEQTASLDRALYWQAPPAFTGNKVLAYGGTLEYVFAYSTNTTMDDPEGYLTNFDLIIEGSSMRFGYSGEYWDKDSRNMIVLNMTEDGWCHLEGSTSPAFTLVPREEFMIVLARVDRLLLRAAFHLRQTEAQLLKISLDVASWSGEGPVLRTVEKCGCPMGYAGTSCESCSPGYRRVSNILMGGSCEPCDCNGHSDTCDPYTGQCLDCRDNTTGFYCDQCLPGCHGDATMVLSDGCAPCACPLDDPTNNFAQDCVMTSAEEGGYMCIGCEPGYEGRFCDRCSAGYYGEPRVPGMSCKPCDCNGNEGPGGGAVCDPITGVCHGCVEPTEGDHCERCKHGYYGSGRNGDCKVCECSPYGSTQSTCDMLTGQCVCKDNYAGTDCGQCQFGFGNVAQGCLRCNCSTIGADTHVCDPITGQCLCKLGVQGHYCTGCQNGHFGFSSRGCEDCQCDADGSVQIQCHQETGECQCRPHVAGKYCNQCVGNHWGLSIGSGCRPCVCDVTGSVSAQCDVDSGQCVCKPGVTGQTCDHCQPGHYRFSFNGCLRCQVCRNAGQVCDPETGECVCPPNTEGPECASCRPNTWGLNLVTGCKPCSCDEVGSRSQQCDAVTGACDCRPQYAGDACDQCPFGYHGFPFCAACDCHSAGTDPGTCRGRVCRCGDTGTCTCKASVMGSSCDMCRPDSFNLQTDNPEGCTDCFCFGRSSSCTQSQYRWQEVTLPDYTISVYTSESSVYVPNVHGFLIVPADAGTVTLHPDHLHLPLYVALPKPLLGDQTLSYNGRFTASVLSSLPEVGFADRPDTNNPDILIQGNYKVQLMYTAEHMASEETLHHSAVLNQHLWTNETRQPVARETFMVGLQNIQQWLVKATDFVGITDRQRRQATGSLQGSRLGSVSVSGLSLQVAMETGDSSLAVGVEECTCPPEYTGLSCQRPAPGYYRWNPADFLQRPLEVIDLVGISVPCQCHGHSDQCHGETGVCKDCQHNTGGNHCQVCLEGFYGDPSQGTPSECQPCACPGSSPERSFSPTCRLDVTGSDFVCDQCQTGYVGDKCEMCAPGYYGDPETVGCEDCGCSYEGTVRGACNTHSGRCMCYPGITGRQCDRCLDRHVVSGARCLSCMEDCPGLLFESIDDFIVILESSNSTAAALLPYSRLSYVDRLLRETQRQVGNTSLPSPQPVLNLAEEIKITAQKMQDKVNDQLDKVDMMMMDGEDLWFEAEDIASEVMAVHKSVEGYIEDGTEKGLTANESLTVEDVMDEAQAILDHIKYSKVNMDMGKLNTGTEVLLGNIARRQVDAMIAKANLSLPESEERLTSSQEKLSEILDLALAAQDNTTDCTAWNEDNISLMDMIKEKLELVQEKQAAFDDSVEEASNINEDSQFLLWNVSSGNYQGSMDLLASLREKSDHVQIKTNLFEKGIPGARPVHNEAVLHARSLREKADQLQRQFADTQVGTKDALNAARVYGVMADHVTDAEAASLQAQAAIDNATEYLDTELDVPVSQRMKQALEDSKDLNDNSTKHQEELADMEERLEKSIADSDAATNNVDEGTRILDDIAKKFNFTQGVTEGLTDVSYKAITTIGKSIKAANIAMDVVSGIENELDEKIDEMQKINAEDITKANASVNVARRELQNVLNLTDTLSEQSERVSRIGTETNWQIMALKEKIKQARELAKNIKISLHHTGSCVRRYEADLQSSATNTVIVHFRTESPSKDMLLFLVHNQDLGEFVVVELVSGRVRFSWDVGGGLGSITHDLDVQGRNNAGQAPWYRVHAERYGSLGRLTVTDMSSPVGGTEVTGVSPDTHTVLDVVSDTPVYVGGAPRDYQLPLVVQDRTFSGCIGGVQFGGKEIGLYNFRELEGGQCDGCHVVPGLESGPPMTYQFDGTGYSMRSGIEHSDTQFSLTLYFKGFWENALLFFTHSEETRDFISLELLGGHIVFRFGAQATMRSALKYNTNQWVKVIAQASWPFKKAALFVNEPDEVIEADMFRPLEVKKQTLYFGGVPATLNISRYGLSELGFLGCLQDVQLGTRMINLMEGITVGVTRGCKPEKLTCVGLDGEGHVELPSRDLPRDASISFSFQTYEGDGLLLLAKGLDIYHFYSLSMVDGELYAWFRAAAGAPTEIMTAGRYDDGEVHSVNVVKSNRRLDLYVDDTRVGRAQMSPGSSRISSMLGDQGGLYVGGVPEGIEATGRAAAIQNFRGCISDVTINSEPFLFGTPLDYTKADIGRCDMERLFPDRVGPLPGQRSTPESFTITITLPTSTSTSSDVDPTSVPAPTKEPTSCADEGMFKQIGGAQAFGDVVHSYAEILVRKKDIVKDFNMAVQVRTYYRRGMVFFITNEIQDDFVAVQVRDGRVIVVYNDRKSDTKEISTNFLVNDGFWHDIRVRKDFKSITVIVDRNTPLTDTISRKIDVIAPIYVGGFDPRFTASAGTITESFKGCMKNFTLNGNAIDLANSKRVMGVRPCFSTVERGVHFDGYGYATYAERYTIESYLRLEMDFKTTRRDGVIISISTDRDNPALALELHNGWLKFSAINTGGSFIAVAGRCEFCLCDNRWHHVVAEYIRNTVTLTVDDSSPKVGLGGDDMVLGLQNELFIGGIPGFGSTGVAQTREFFNGCLRNLMINGTQAEWHQMFELENVHVAACPISDDS